MAKKSGGSGILVVVGIGIAILSTIPKEVWIALGFAAVVVAAIYFWVQHKKDNAASVPAPDSDFHRPPPASAFTPRAVLSDTPAAPAFAPTPRTARRDLDEPVSVVPASRQNSASKVPAAPEVYQTTTWVPAGHSVTVAGTVVPGGMLYVGTSLKTPSGRNDPSLIDPTKKVAAQGDYTERQMNYWPSYSEVTPAARRAYLNWLAGGRQDPEADVGYVFLFMYGLERRAIVDSSGDDAHAKEAAAELPLIAAEVRRLLGIYGRKSGSFHRYATDFLAVAELANYTEKLYAKPVPHFPSGSELPVYLRLALGQCAVDGVPVPPALALTWARMDPNISLRTPATRCAEQFDLLFERKYLELLGPGLSLPKNKTKLKFVYRPASSGLAEYGEIKLTFGDTPDVAVLTGPVKKLQEVVEATALELDAFSRMVGRAPGSSTSMEGLLLLPPTLWPAPARQRLEAIAARLDQGMAVMTLQELSSSLGELPSLERPTVLSLARALQASNIEMEPDVLAGAKLPKAEDTVVLFAVQPGEIPDNRSTGTYQAAVLTLELATAVATADGDLGAEEMRQLRNQIAGWTHLTPGHHSRLRAHLRLLMAAPPSLTSLKKKLDPLSVAAKEAIAEFLAVVAHADGKVSPAEVKMLEKVYKVLGVDPQKVFSHLHAVAAGPAPVRSAGGDTVVPTFLPPGAKQPGSPVLGTTQSTGFKLDTARIAALQQDTDRVSAILSNIFVEEPVPQPVVPPALPAEDARDATVAPYSLQGLDAAHISFVHQLVSRPQWTRDELLDLSSDLDLMLDGALERVNDASFDSHDMALTEGEDPITLNREILEKAPA